MRRGGGPAVECHRSAWRRPQRGSWGAVWHPLPPVPVGRGGKSRGRNSASGTPRDKTLPGGLEGVVVVLVDREVDWSPY